MSTATCPNCGHSLTVRLLELDGPAPRPSLRFETGPGDLPIARPRPVSRGTGPDRLKAWGAVADTPVAPGDRLQIVAKSGKTWAGTVAECLGAAAGGGHLVTLAGAEWTPDPDVDADGRHPPSDPAWLHDGRQPGAGSGAASARRRFDMTDPARNLTATGPPVTAARRWWDR